MLWLSRNTQPTRLYLEVKSSGVTCRALADTATGRCSGLSTKVVICLP